MENVLKYSITDEQIFEHIIKEDDFEFNHVIIKPRFSFPTHPTDANVTITVIRGILSIVLEQEQKHRYEKGAVIQVPEGIISTLSNEEDISCEVFVIKRR